MIFVVVNPTCLPPPLLQLLFCFQFHFYLCFNFLFIFVSTSFSSFLTTNNQSTMAAVNQTWSFVVPIEDSNFNNCLSGGVYKLAESMGKSTSKGKECTLCYLKFHKSNIAKHMELCKNVTSRTRDLAEKFHTKVKQRKFSYKNFYFVEFNRATDALCEILQLITCMFLSTLLIRMRCNNKNQQFFNCSQRSKNLPATSPFSSG